MAAGMALAGMLASPLAADTPGDTPRQVVERAVAAHGGALWLDPGTFELSGTATFYDPATGAVRSTAEDYRMWRTFEDSLSGLVTVLRRSPERLELATGDRRDDEAFRRVQAGG
jgi:hypothetical protein